jgi:hypothetical protein
LITSFVLKEPYNAHQKSQLFTDHYYRIFSRHISPPLIYLLYKMHENIDRNCANIKNFGARDYGTTRFFFLYLFRQIFEQDEIGCQLIEDPNLFHNTYKDKYNDAFNKLSKLLVLDFNNQVSAQEEKEQYFDYKNILRNAQMTSQMAREIIRDYEKSLIFHPEEKFSALLAV